MHVDKNSGINKNPDKIDIQQPLTTKQQTSVFGEGFSDLNNDGIVNSFDFDNDEIIIRKLDEENLLNKFWNDVGNKVNSVLKGYKKSDRFPQSISIERADGIKIELIDSISLEIPNDDNADFSHLGDILIDCIIYENNKSHKIKLTLGDCIQKDILDNRRVKKEIANYLSNLSSKNLDKILKNNITEINIYSKPNEWNKKKSGIEIVNGHMEIISKDFKIPERKYQKNYTYTRQDGSKFDVHDIAEYSSILTITLPKGDTYTITINGAHNKDFYHQFQLQQLKMFIKNLPLKVLEDMKNEIDEIVLAEADSTFKFEAIYVKGSNSFVVRTGHDERGEVNLMSVIHEIGHAIDDINGNMKSKEPNFANKFNKLKELSNNLNIQEHSLDNAEEFLASMYAYINLPDEKQKINHINNLDNIILKYKNSPEGSDEKECYMSYLDLKHEAQIILNESRNVPVENRKNSDLKQFVEKEFRDIIDSIDKYILENRANATLKELMKYHSTKLFIIDYILANDIDYKESTDIYKDWLEDDNIIGNQDIKNIFSELINRVQLFRNKSV